MNVPKRLRLNEKGVSAHLLLPILAILAVAGIGTYLLGVDHAATVVYNGPCTGATYSATTNNTGAKAKTCIQQAKGLMDGIQHQNYKSYRTAKSVAPNTNCANSTFRYKGECYLLMNGTYAAATTAAVKALPLPGGYTAPASLTSGTNSNSGWQILCLDAVAAGLTSGNAGKNPLVFNGKVNGEYTVSGSATIFKNTCGSLIKSPTTPPLSCSGGATLNAAKTACVCPAGQQATTATGACQKIPVSGPITTPVTDGGNNTPSTAAAPVGVTGNWSLKFDDEFTGTSLNTNNWSTVNGWHTNNVTTYTSNVSVSGGNLVLTLASSASGAEVDSSQADGAKVGYGLPVGGYAEARINFPGKSTDQTIYNWPAWWVSGPNWPAAGESDIAEGLGTLTVNYHSPSGAHNHGTIPGIWSNAFHVYGVYRHSNSCDVYYDGHKVMSYPTDDNGQPEFLIVNVGNGNQAAYGTASQVKVDYVRAWQPQ